jgi:predicted ATPase/class 3 adenylate cyclase
VVSSLPAGNVSFLFTDIEGSTKLAQEFPQALPDLLKSHHAILRESIEGNGGHVFQIVGDAFCAAFDSALNALTSAVAAQQRLDEHPWRPVAIRVRMGITTGPAQPGVADNEAGGYSGYSTLARAQRIMSAAYGGQVLLSQSSADLTLTELRGGVALRDLGMHRLKGFPQPERLWQIIVPGLRNDFPPLPTDAAIPNNLPNQVTSFVGRQPEISELVHLLPSSNLLTLTGAGGTGKSRLSLELAAAALDSFHDGAWLVELAPITDPSFVPMAVARVLGLREEQGLAISKTVLDHLRDRHLLLILDNCEHLVEAAAQFADSVIHSCRDVRILSTSREPLGLSGERVWPVTPLPVPDPLLPQPIHEIEEYAAVRLFLDRARYLAPSFQLTAENATSVKTICHKLDGMPLALELAAARVKQLGVDQLAVRLDDRFRLLSSGSRTAIPRQQTLRALIDWSHALLSDEEKVLLRRVSLFSGGWTLEAAEEVCSGEKIGKDQVLDSMTRLVDKSMVVTYEKGNTTRYRLLETIRQYATEKLAESTDREALAGKHAEFFTKMAEQIEPRLMGADEVYWLDRLDLDHENVRVALGWCAQSQSSVGVRLAGAMWRFWLTRGHWTEGRRWLSQMIDSFPEAESAARAKAILGAGALAFYQRDHDAATRLLDESVVLFETLGDFRNQAWAFFYLGWMANDRGNPALAVEMLERGLRLFGALFDKHGIAHTRLMLGLVCFFRGDVSAAQAHVEASLTLSREIRDLLGTAWSLYLISMLLALEGHPEAASRPIEESISILETLGDRRNRAYAMGIRGLAALANGDTHGASRAEKESMVTFQELGDGYGVCCAMSFFTAVMLAERKTDSAFYLAGAVASYRERTGVFFPALVGSYLARVESTRTDLRSAADQAFARGYAMDLDQAVAYVLQIE